MYEREGKRLGGAWDVLQITSDRGLMGGKHAE